MAQLTAGLLNLQHQLNVAFPGRKLPDGWIGDAIHRARISGHNPDDTPGSRPAWDGDPDTMPEVRALDVARDLGNGVNPQILVNHLRYLPGLSAVLRYIIFDGHIYHVRNAFVPVPVPDGTDPHTDHLHFEGAWSQTADRDTTYNFHLERVPVMLTAQDKSWISDEIARQLRTFGAGDGDTSPRVYSRDGLATTTEQDTKQIRATLTQLEATFARIEEKLSPKP